MKRTGQYPALDFWSVLTHLTVGDKVIRDRLDIPLETAISRSRYAIGWTVTIVLAAWLTHRYSTHPLPGIALHMGLPLRVGVCTAAVCVLWLLSWTVGYGFLRLFTLLNHNLTTNLFKVRGQRLRLLNLFTSALSLCVPITAATLLEPISGIAASTLIVVLTIYLAVLLSRTYNLIFHKSRWHGLSLVIGGWMVTSFVIVIGALAVAVAIAVIVLLALLIIRPLSST